VKKSAVASQCRHERRIAEYTIFKCQGGSHIVAAIWQCIFVFQLKLLNSGVH